MWLPKYISFFVIFFLGRQLTPSRYRHGCCWSSVFPFHRHDLCFLQPCGCPSRDHVAVLGLGKGCPQLLLGAGKEQHVSAPCQCPRASPCCCSCQCPRASPCCCSGGTSPGDLRANLTMVAGADFFGQSFLAGLGLERLVPALGQRTAGEAVSVEQPLPAQCMSGRCCSPQDHPDRQHTPASIWTRAGSQGAAASDNGEQINVVFF